MAESGMIERGCRQEKLTNNGTTKNGRSFAHCLLIALGFLPPLLTKSHPDSTQFNTTGADVDTKLRKLFSELDVSRTAGQRGIHVDELKKGLQVHK